MHTTHLTMCVVHKKLWLIDFTPLYQWTVTWFQPTNQHHKVSCSFEFKITPHYFKRTCVYNCSFCYSKHDFLYYFIMKHQGCKGLDLHEQYTAFKIISSEMQTISIHIAVMPKCNTLLIYVIIYGLQLWQGELERAI